MKELLNKYKPYLPQIRKFCREHLNKETVLYYKSTYRDSYLYSGAIDYTLKTDPACILLQAFLKEALTGNNSATITYDPKKGFLIDARYTEWIDTKTELNYPLPKEVWFSRVNINVSEYGSGVHTRVIVMVDNGPVGEMHQQLENDLTEYINGEVKACMKKEKARMSHIYLFERLNPGQLAFTATVPINLKRYKKRTMELPLHIEKEKTEVVTL